MFAGYRKPRDTCQTILRTINTCQDKYTLYYIGYGVDIILKREKGRIGKDLQFFVEILKKPKVNIDMNKILYLLSGYYSGLPYNLQPAPFSTHVNPPQPSSTLFNPLQLSLTRSQKNIF
jgi:hypothetical protein